MALRRTPERSAAAAAHGVRPDPAPGPDVGAMRAAGRSHSPTTSAGAADQSHPPATGAGAASQLPPDALGTVAPGGIAAAGLIALAVGMGIGRFAFTPILPMMQRDAGLSIAHGAWLASAN